jgi:hypothetical protein
MYAACTSKIYIEIRKSISKADPYGEQKKWSKKIFYCSVLYPDCTRKLIETKNGIDEKTRK